MNQSKQNGMEKVESIEINSNKVSSIEFKSNQIVKSKAGWKQNGEWNKNICLHDWYCTGSNDGSKM